VPRASSILSPGDSLGGFQIVNVIGFGGMAVVYRAEQISLGRPVALKVLSPQLSGDREFRERFRREGKHVAALEHPNIVTIYDSGEDDGRLYLAMRLIEGSTLGERMHEQGLSADETIAILRPIANALDVAHDARLVHRDVKPHNILLSQEGHPYLADFGVAKGPQTHGLTATGGFVGSLNYAAPEQILGQPVTAAGDVYALTAVLYQCLTGEVPYPRETDAGVMHAHLTDPPPALPGGDKIEDVLSKVIARGMAKDPGQRFARAGDLLDAAVNTLDGLPAERRREIPTFTPAGGENGSSTGSAGAVWASGAQVAPPAHTAEPPSLPEGPAKAVPQPAGATEIVSRREPGAHIPGSDATTADRRRDLPPAAPATTSGAGKRRWPLAVAGVALLAVAGAGAALATSGSSPAKLGPQTAADSLLSLSYPPTWRRSTNVHAEDASLLSSPLLLANGGSTIAAGELASSAAIPGGIPPSLIRVLHAPVSQASVRVNGYVARRYEWRTSGGIETLALILATKAADVALVCRGPETTIGGCVAIAGSVRVRGVVVQAPGIDRTLDAALLRDFGPVATARGQSTGLTSTSLASRAPTAVRLALADTQAAATIGALAAPQRNHAAVASLAAALQREASTWTQLASAADHNERSRYAEANISISVADGSLRAGAKALAVEGYMLPALSPLRLPGLPPVKPPKSSSTGTAASTSGAATGQASTTGQPTGGTQTTSSQNLTVGQSGKLVNQTGTAVKHKTTTTKHHTSTGGATHHHKTSGESTTTVLKG
jgi:serine/threonine protein kinase